jgi:hypothetical protein
MRVDAETLFARVYDELQQRIGRQPGAAARSHNDMYEALACSRPLRQLLLDELPLAESANTASGKRRLRIRYVVTQDPPEPFPDGLVFSITLDGVDPDTSLVAGRTILSLKLTQFIRHRVMKTPGGHVTVGGIIKHAANRLGGIHLENELDQQMYDQISDGVLLYQLEGIGRVTLKALKPLRRVCKPRW